MTLPIFGVNRLGKPLHKSDAVGIGDRNHRHAVLEELRKERVIDLIQQVRSVSVAIIEIVDGMEHREGGDLVGLRGP